MQVNGFLNTYSPFNFKGSTNKYNDIRSGSATDETDDEWNIIAYDPATADTRKAIRKRN